MESRKTFGGPGTGGPTFDVYQSEKDGAWIVHIQTENMECDETGPYPLRVYINDDTDDPAYENPPYPEEGEEDNSDARKEADRVSGLRADSKRRLHEYLSVQEEAIPEGMVEGRSVLLSVPLCPACHRPDSTLPPDPPHPLPDWSTPDPLDWRTEQSRALQNDEEPQP